MIGIERSEEDAFRAWVERVVNGVVAIADPAAVHMVELDHWFDDKWLGFSGKTLGALGVWAGDLTVPPFHPHRVRSETHYSRVGTGTYSLVVPSPRLHREQPSDHNLHLKHAEVGWRTTVLKGITASALTLLEERRAG